MKGSIPASTCCTTATSKLEYDFIVARLQTRMASPSTFAGRNTFAGMSKAT